MIASRARAFAMGTLICAGALGWISPPALGLDAERDSADREERFKALVKESALAREAGDLQRTAILLEQAIHIRPAPNMVNNLGRIYEELGNYKGAVEAYKRVTLDPDADGVLKRLDATRIELLTPRLARAWLRPSAPMDDVRLYVDGRLVTIDDPREIDVDPGALALELVRADQGRSQLIFGIFSAGQTHPLAPALDDEAPGHGRLVWEVDGPLEAVVINGYTLVASLQTLSSIQLAAGRYVVEVRQPGRAPTMQHVALADGAVHDLSQAIQGAPDATPSVQAHAPARTSPLSWVTVGGGALSAMAGATLLGLAASDRADVLRATEAETVTTMTQPEAYRLQDRADALSTAGAVLVGLGSTALSAGLLLWLTEDEGSDEPQEPALQVVPTPGGVEALWRF